MSGYLLDTNIISDVVRNPAGAAARRIEQVGQKALFASIIVASVPNWKRLASLSV